MGIIMAVAEVLLIQNDRNHVVTMAPNINLSDDVIGWCVRIRIFIEQKVCVLYMVELITVIWFEFKVYVYVNVKQSCKSVQMCLYLLHYNY